MKNNSTFKSSQKANSFTESVIREMSRIAAKYNAINLAQGLPDFNANIEFKQAGIDAINNNINQYAITWGNRHLRKALAQKYSGQLNTDIDPETEITVTCGATEAMVATFLALINPGDEVIIFEPYYENYSPDTILAGAKPIHVRLYPENWTFNEDELTKAFNHNTKAIIINTPHNPTGKVFSHTELTTIAQLCQKWGVIAITDEIYEHILYDNSKHISIASLPGMEELTVTINSLSKTYSLTGWRVGWAIANSELTQSIRKVHDFLTVGSPAPLQAGAVTAINAPNSYYEDLKKDYDTRRSLLMDILDNHGFKYYKPGGAYYLFTDISSFGYASDLDFAQKLIENVKIAVVPGSSFITNETYKHKYVRFCFSRKIETLNQAATNMKDFKSIIL